MKILESVQIKTCCHVLDRPMHTVFCPLCKWKNTLTLHSEGTFYSWAYIFSCFRLSFYVIDVSKGHPSVLRLLSNVLFLCWEISIAVIKNSCGHFVRLLPVLLFWVSKAGVCKLMKTDSDAPVAPARPQGVTFSYRQSKGRSSFRIRAGPFHPHPFHMVLLGEVLRGLTQPGLWKTIRAKLQVSCYWCTGTGQVRGAEAIRESRGQLGTKREGHPGPHYIGVSPRLHKLVVLNPWMAHLMGPQKHCLGAVTLALFFLVTPHCPAPQITCPSLVFLSFWCEHGITPIKDHTNENVGHQSWREYVQRSVHWQKPCLGPQIKLESSKLFLKLELEAVMATTR